jgi:Glycosyl transferase family 2
MDAVTFAMTSPRLTIVIPTRNRPQALLRVLQSISGQTLPPMDFEFVVVDDGSDPPVDAVRMTEGFPFPVRLIRRTGSRGLTKAGAPACVRHVLSVSCFSMMTLCCGLWCLLSMLPCKATSQSGQSRTIQRRRPLLTLLISGIKRFDTQPTRIRSSVGARESRLQSSILSPAPPASYATHLVRGNSSVKSWRVCARS